jgi:hypothetical protein
MPLLVRLLVPAILPLAVRRQRRDLERRIVAADSYSFSADAQTLGVVSAERCGHRSMAWRTAED